MKDWSPVKQPIRKGIIMKIIIVGGVAGGASAAARARRLDSKAEITIYERGEYISFANCGLPYHVGKVIEERQSLLLLKPEELNAKTGIKVKIRHEVVAINRKAKKIEIKNLETGQKFEDDYDKIILAPGSSPIRPKIPGADDPGVKVLWTINDMDSINSEIDAGAKKAIVIGGGFIGLEVAENLRHRQLDTALVEMLPHVMPQMDAEMAQPIHDELQENGVKLFLNNGVTKITKISDKNSENTPTKFKVELKDDTVLDADLIVMAIGVKPNNELAVSSDLDIGETGGIKVNDQLQTSDPDIYAVGDAIEVKNLVSEAPARIPLAGPANRQGRIAANNIFGAKESYSGSIGTAICKVFSLAVGSTGMSENMLKKAEIKYRKLYINPSSHASYYPGAQVMNIKVLFNDKGLILGAQIVGPDGVDKRIDILATAIRNKLTLKDLEELELAYAPPYGSAKDPINFVGFVGNNILKGDTKIIYPTNVPEDNFILDVRTEDEFLCGALPNSVNIPLEILRERVDEIPEDKPVTVLCRTGVRSYNAERYLRSCGYETNNISGGYFTWLLFHPEKGSTLKEETCWQPPAENSNKKNKDNIPMNNDADIELNACGLQCPGPIVAVKNKLESMQDGQILKVIASDMGFRKDLPSWCQATNNELLKIEKGDSQITAFVRKGAESTGEITEAISTPIKKTTIVLFSNDLDKSIAAFILATGFASLGHEVSIFFTFWGLNVLRKDNPPSVKKDFLSRMFGMMMPRGAKKLALSKMHMMGMGTAMMKHVMNSKNVDSLPDLIKQARSMGVKFIACEMAMNVMGISMEELMENVDTAGVANFAALAEKSGTTLFI